MTSDARAGSHLVHFFEDEPELVASVAEFLTAGIYAGDGVAVIARPARIDAFAAAMHELGLDAGHEERVVVVDADALLDRFVRDGHPDPARFAQVVAHLLQEAGRGRPGLHVYGEMVSILWERGEVNAALEVEELWNDLAAALRFVLYCAYPRSAVSAPGHAASFETARRLHSDVLVTHGEHGHAHERGLPGTYAHFERTALGPAAARAFVARTLGGLEDQALVDVARLVVSELAANAVLHGGPGGPMGSGTFTVAVTRLPDCVRISVRDDSAAMPEPRRPQPGRTGGRGLGIVAALAKEWGALPDGAGKIVWAELARPTGAGPSAPAPPTAPGT